MRNLSHYEDLLAKFDVPFSWRKTLEAFFINVEHELESHMEAIKFLEGRLQEELVERPLGSSRYVPTPERVIRDARPS